VDIATSGSGTGAQALAMYRLSLDGEGTWPAMTYVAVVGISLIFVLAVVVGIVDARSSAHWRQVAAERRRAWESAHLRDDAPTGPQPLASRR
jgi:hypothetical protein